MLFTNPSDMKKTIPFLSTILLMGLLVSCHKETEKNIVFGDTKGMLVEAYDTFINLGWTKELDIDADGTADLKLVSYYDGPHMEYTQTLTLRCLNENIALRGEMMEKTSYIHRDTIVGNAYGVLGVLYLSVYSSCTMFSENDKAHTYHTFVPSDDNYGDLFNMNQNFQSTDIILFRENTQEVRLDHTSNDTSYFYRSNYLYDCENFPSNIDKYIGFRINKDGTSRLGWLKLNLIGGETVNVHLIETAIQE